MDRSIFRPLVALCLFLLVSTEPVTADDNPPQKGEMAGYVLVPHEKVDKKYNAGFSMYVAAWPLLKNYPGQEFPSGLFGTWMFSQYDGPKPEKIYSDIEGGLGWWRDTRLATETGTIDPKAAAVHTFKGGGGATWQIYPPNTARENKAPVAWSSFATPTALDDTTYGYKWAKDTITKDGSLVTLPEYYRLEKDKKDKEKWVVVNAKDVPAETGLAKVDFPRVCNPKQQPYVTPDEADSSWKKPGPAAGPSQAKLGDGSVVTYYWYRFADQPALLNADLTAAEREMLQTRVELLHKHWTKDREYLPPPTVGKLANLDPAVLVTPPMGLEVGYVPIVTRQEAKE